MSNPSPTTSQSTLAGHQHSGSFVQRITNWLQQHWKQILLWIPFAWLLLFFLTPFFIVLKISVAEPLIASPPFSALLEWGEGFFPTLSTTINNYSYLWEDPLYVNTYFNSLQIALTCTVICLLIGYPMAYGIVRSSGNWKLILLLLVMLPFWSSFLLRVYAWMGILADQGTINDILIWLRIIDKPIRLLYTEFAVYVGIVYTYLPFMILPLYANLEKLDFSLNDAAADLGARPTITFFTVTIPLTWPGIVAGCLLVFIPATGEFVIPDLLGGGNVLMIGRVLSSEFNANRDWPVASAVAVVLLIVLVVPMMLYHRVQAHESNS